MLRSQTEASTTSHTSRGIGDDSSLPTGHGHIGRFFTFPSLFRAEALCCARSVSRFAQLSCGLKYFMARTNDPPFGRAFSRRAHRPARAISSRALRVLRCPPSARPAVARERSASGATARSCRRFRSIRGIPSSSTTSCA